MILIIKTNKERLHDLEFVKPIEEILKQNKIKFLTKNYKKITNKDLKQVDKIIISGTSLKDNEFLRNKNNFKWIKDSKKPVLGICAGMQIISNIFKAKIKSKTEIGFFKEKFKRNFLGLNNDREVYHLHNNYFDVPKEFKSFTNSLIPQAIKHKTREIYGTLFHPEVRNSELILNFVLNQ